MVSPKLTAPMWRKSGSSKYRWIDAEKWGQRGSASSGSKMSPPGRKPVSMVSGAQTTGVPLVGVAGGGIAGGGAGASGAGGRRFLDELDADGAGDASEDGGDARAVGVGGRRDLDDAIGDPNRRRGCAERLLEYSGGVST